MFSKNFKRKVAVLLTGVMVLGMTVTAAAETGKTGNGNADGDGQFEGHVNRKVVDVTLPTNVGDTFDFIVDSEGLMKETKDNGAAVWSPYTFPETNTNVYFTTGTKKFDSTSNTLTVSNNSSVSINVALEVSVEDPGTLKLVSSNTALPTDGKTAALWLGLKIDDKAAETVSESGIEKTVSVNGTKDNYQVSVNEVNGKREYSFVKKAGATGWKTLQFALTGVANKVDSAKDSTAPKLKVTWKYEAAEWEDGGSTPSPAAGKAPSIATTSYKKSESTSGLAIDVDFGSGSLVGTAMTGVQWSSDGTTFKDYSNPSQTNVTFNNSTKKINVDGAYITGMSGQRWFRVYFDSSTTKYVEFTITND